MRPHQHLEKVRAVNLPILITEIGENELTLRLRERRRNHKYL
jgi:hypothetical protein